VNEGLTVDISTERTCLIFDEIDWMSVGDHSGLAELTKNIWRNLIPIVCICNLNND
jgi:hypothetical protein